MKKRSENDESDSKLCELSDMPKKRFFRSRAHCNPLSHNDGFEYPLNPDQYADSWRNIHFPGLQDSHADSKLSVDFLDIGMGFG